MSAPVSRRPISFGALFAFAAMAGAVLLAAPLVAHHSTAMFEWGKEVPMKNLTVDKWDWSNPHTYLYTHDDKGQKWAFEGMSPNHLVRFGWSKRSVVPGDKINITYYPLKDGRHGGFNVTITKASGQLLKQFGDAGSTTARQQAQGKP
jgi:hypothetical protein